MRTFYKDGSRASEEFRLSNKREGRCRYWRKDGTLDEERPGWFEIGERKSEMHSERAKCRFAEYAKHERAHRKFMEQA